MENPTGICKEWANLYLFPVDTFLCPTLPATPTEADYQDVIDSINTHVSSSTKFGGKRVEAMIEKVSMEMEYGDVKSIKTACGKEYCRQVKPKKTVKATIWNCKDPNIVEVITGIKGLLGADNRTMYRSEKLACMSQPNVIAKIVTCPDENGLSDEYYILPTTLQGTMVTMWQDYCENDFEGSELELSALSGACCFQVIRTFDPAQNLNPATS